MWGPQTHSEVPAPSSANTQLNPTPAIQERLLNMEKHMGLNTKEQPIPLDVYGRLKALEDRILHLESISPEYFEGPFNLQSSKDGKKRSKLFFIDIRKIAQLSTNNFKNLPMVWKCFLLPGFLQVLEVQGVNKK